jgi:hypothetical protein
MIEKRYGVLMRERMEALQKGEKMLVEYGERTRWQMYLTYYRNAKKLPMMFRHLFQANGLEIERTL